MRRHVKGNSLLNGPQIHANAPGVVSSQDQVDDLLDSLGFNADRVFNRIRTLSAGRTTCFPV